VLFVAIDDQMRAFLLVVQSSVGQDAGKLKNAVLDGIQSTHFEIDPKQLGDKIDAH
jgi:hypothetical protein